MSDYIIIALLTLAVYYPLTLGGAGGDDVLRLAAAPVALLAVGVGAVDGAVRAVRQGGV